MASDGQNMADAKTKSFSTESASLFEPNHLTTIYYPFVALLEDGDRMVLMGSRDRDIRQRYEPLPLIEHDGVAKQSGREALANSSFTSVTEADIEASDAFVAADVQLPDAERLASDMAALSTCTGLTTLGFVLVRHPEAEPDASSDDGRREVLVRLRRDTKLRCSDFSTVEDVATYSMSLEALDDLRNTGLWHYLLHHLMVGTSDRAHRHQRLFLEMQGQDGRRHKDLWLPRRRPDMAEAINQVCLELPAGEVEELRNISQEDERDQVCAICYIPWSEIDDKILSTPCHHLFCEPDLLKDTTHHGMAAICPKCRQPLFASDAVKRVTFGLDSSGQYQDDHRFSHWENVERSFADLDEEHAQDDRSTTLTFSEAAALNVWQCIVEHALREPNTSCPSWLNPAKQHEWSVVDDATRFVIKAMQNQSITPAELLQKFKNEQFNAWVAAWRDGPIGSMLSPEENQILTPENMPGALLHLRPGQQDFVGATLNRLVRFLMLRECQCKYRHKPHIHEGNAHRLWYSTFEGNWSLVKREISLEEEAEALRRQLAEVLARNAALREENRALREGLASN
ncbi:hypothetical protein HII31_05748 [Pseudocercospora fuligena]|uniref:RING-type domain-containing protein n=1 Tax=Pseudocercospora fuligena TaxID=685502 RepID=A0A8H6RLQ8_9PEZI|nr:hypothetical protein HII31_05748 [Pseudocercospora fuligena]